MAFYKRPTTYERPDAFRPHCTHTTMTRVYEKDSVCCSCRQPGQLGWLYRCTQDIEKIIDIGPPEIDPSNPDSINALGVREGDRLGFGDMPEEEIAKCTPEILRIISRQREEVKNLLARGEFKRSSNVLFNTSRPSPSFESHTNDSIYTRQWSCGEPEICQYRVCPWCRPAAADRAFLDMGAIADGEIPVTAAIGLGFEQIGGKPIVSSEVVKRIGQRGPPAKIFTPPESPADDAFLNECLMLMLDEKVAGYSYSRRPPPPRRSITKDDLYTVKPSNFQAVKSDSDRMKALSNVHRRQPSKSAMASRQAYLELLPSMEEMPTPTRRRESSESPARPAIELDRHEFRRAQRLEQMKGEPREASESPPLFHTDDSWDTDLLTDLDDDACDFTPAPLRVDRGVSVTEESIETGVPDVDVITQV